MSFVEELLPIAYRDRTIPKSHDQEQMIQLQAQRLSFLCDILKAKKLHGQRKIWRNCEKWSYCWKNKHL